MNLNSDFKNICIVGAGLSGTMCAAMLGKLGYNVSVFEKRDLDAEKKEVFIMLLYVLKYFQTNSD